MEQELYIKLIQQELSGAIGKKERQLLTEWKSLHSDNQLLAENIAKAWNASSSFGQNIPLDLKRDYAKVQQKIDSAHTGRIFRISYYISTIAASLLVLLGAYVWLKPPSAITILANQDNYVVELPDGTEIHLSNGSELVYSFDYKENRNVQMKGSAFFDVEENAANPFVVTSPNATTTVLGTMFFVDDKTKGTSAIVNLIEGRVRVNSLVGGQEMFLSPGEKVIIKADGFIDKQGQLSLENQQWYFDNFSFDDVTLAKAILLIEDYFNTSIIVGKGILECRVSGRIPFSSAEKMIQTIADIYGASVTARDTGYELIGGSCEISE